MAQIFNYDTTTYTVAPGAEVETGAQRALAGLMAIQYPAPQEGNNLEVGAELPV